MQPIQAQSQEPKLSLKWVELIPRPTLEEIDHITASIKKHGQQTPIVVDQNYVVMDGYTRYKICKVLGLKCKFIVKQFKDDDERTDYIMIANVERRHLKAFDKVRLFRHIYVTEQALAKERQKLNRKLRIMRPEGRANRKIHSGEAIHEFAKKIGIGAGTAKRALVVLDEAKEDEIDLVKKGVVAITTMYHTIQMRKRRMDEHLMPCTIKIINKYTEKTKVIEKRLTRPLYDQLVAYVERL